MAEIKENQNQMALREESSTQYLTFKIGDDDFGINILSVQEIHGWIPPRPIPETPDYIKGLIDWRGLVVPVVDLRERFKFERVSDNKSTVIIIIKSLVEAIAQNCTIAIIVDGVSDVCDIADSDVKRAPNLGSNIDTEFIKGIVKIDHQMVIVLDLGKLLNLDNLFHKI